MGVPSDSFILTNQDLWGIYFTFKNSKSLNDSVLRVDALNLRVQNWESPFIDLSPVHNIYLDCDNLGGYDIIAPDGNRSIFKKVPVTASFGYLITHSVTVSEDYVDVSRQTIKTMKWSLLDSRGNIIPLHGSNWSFSLVFAYRTNM
jgi:hypothetical protein